MATSVSPEVLSSARWTELPGVGYPCRDDGSAHPEAQRRELPPEPAGATASQRASSAGCDLWSETLEKAKQCNHYHPARHLDERAYRIPSANCRQSVHFSAQTPGEDQRPACDAMADQRWVRAAAQLLHSHAADMRNRPGRRAHSDQSVRGADARDAPTAANLSLRGGLRESEAQSLRSDPWAAVRRAKARSYAAGPGFGGREPSRFLGTKRWKSQKLRWTPLLRQHEG